VNIALVADGRLVYRSTGMATVREYRDKRLHAYRIAGGRAPTYRIYYVEVRTPYTPHFTTLPRTFKLKDNVTHWFLMTKHRFT
jgi:hypothetical protein